MLSQIIAVDETLARVFELELKRQSNKCQHRSSPQRHSFDITHEGHDHFGL